MLLLPVNSTSFFNIVFIVPENKEGRKFKKEHFLTFIR